MIAYGGNEQSGGGFVEDDEGKIAGQMAQHMARRIWSSVTESLVRLYDEQHLICSLGEAVVLLQAA